ncbi:NAD(P)-dependent oxidoreductase [Rhodopseudomonas sp. G2_2311]|uniref:NAD-dependent epimerase/dehydratase family protein n=1 Tax=Rhodopseudomonas sp. G2_2311 TaxID=3114287 RepID=UPI0039C72C50
MIGASGFIGSAIVEQLQNDPRFEVIPSGRAQPKVSSGAWIRYRSIELTDPEGIAVAFQGCDAIVNCARFPPGEAQNRRIMGDIIDGAKRAGVRTLIHFSSIAVYGSATGEVKEETRAVSPVNSYGIDKSAAESVCGAKAEAGLNIVVLRPTLVYGNGGQEWTERYMDALQRGNLKYLVRNGDGIANLVYVKDVARFCSDLLQASLPQLSTMIVNGADLVRFNEYFSLIARVFSGVSLERVDIPKWKWDVRRHFLRGLRKITRAVPSVSLAINFKGVMFIDESYNAYSGTARYLTDEARRYGFTPAYTVLQGLDDMARTRAR